MAITDSGLGATRGANRVGQTLSAILKEYYIPGVRDQLNSKTVLMRYIRKREEAMPGGKYWVSDLNISRNFGYGHIAELGRLPDPGAQGYVQAQYSPRSGYGRIRFTGQSASSSRSDKGSFVRIMDAEIQGLTRDIQHDTNRIMFGDGSGRLCELVARLSAGVYSTRNPGGISGSSPTNGTLYLQTGMRVATVNSDTAAVTVATAPTASFGSNRAGTITAVDKTNGTVTLSSDITLSTPNYLYIASEISTDLPGSSWARGHEPNGLAAIVSDTNPVFQDGVSGNWVSGLGGVPVATYSVWKSPVLGDGTLTPFTPDMFQVAMDLVDIAGDGVVTLWVTTHGIRRQYLNSLVGSKRYPNTMELDGGFKALTYDGRPIVVDKDCTPGRIYGLNMDTIALYYETDWDWIDQDGSVLHRLPNQDAFQATMVRHWQVGTQARNQNVLITDVMEA